ncbi:MAG: AtpZ/AtpI family protein [Propionibacterium sp.]|nr:AtpZ/AtpI family protein [Propionibacterium sp.]
MIAYLAAGLLFYGGIGWLLDRWLDTSFLLPVGIIVGVVLAMYSIIKRYGNPESKTEEEQ